MNTVFFISIFFFTNECYKHKLHQIYRSVQHCSFLVYATVCFLAESRLTPAPFNLSTDTHVASTLGFRIYRKEMKNVFGTVYNTVHEHTKKPVENISIVSSEALLLVKLHV